MIGSYSKELGITWKSRIIQIKLCKENHLMQSQILEVYFLIRKRTLSMKEEEVRGGGGGGGGRRVLQIFPKIVLSTGEHRPKYFMTQ